MKLVIVESPNKCTTISHYLGNDYKVVASKGHVRDLSKKGVGGFGIVPEEDFKPIYEIIPNKYKIVKSLQDDAKHASEIILATDPDREGEAIAWHLSQILKLNPNKTKRLEFHEITRDSITKAIESPRTIDLNLVASQETRRIIDRVIGFKLSNIIQKKINSRSAGRVQSATLKLICDHEREIREFKPEEYWSLVAKIDVDGTLIDAKFATLNGKTTKIKNSLENEQILHLIGKGVVVTDIKKTTRIVESKPAFKTSTLQQEAFSVYGFSASKTAAVAQSLYEGIEINGEHVGLITYIRTDRSTLAESFVKSARSFIANRYGEDYVGQVKTIKSAALSQEAHEGIRPTSIYRFPDSIKSQLKPDMYKLYKLIYNRTLASLMSNAKEEVKTVTFETNGVGFKASGTKTIFDGFKKVNKVKEDDEELIENLPEVMVNKHYNVKDIVDEQKFTEPPARYSEGKIVKLMEEKGIGRPSTYASTIYTLIERKYVTSEKGLIIPTEQGLKTSFVLNKYFPDVVNIDYTANMEEDLDQIQEGERSRVDVLNDFYYHFMDIAEKGSELMYKDEAIKVGRDCPICGSPLVIKKGPYGDFIGCSNYPSCKYKEIEHEELKYAEGECPKCHSPLVYRQGTGRKKFIACSAFPNCDYIQPTEESQKIIKKCPDCGGNIIIKYSKGKRFLGCSNYPSCKHQEPYYKAKKYQAKDS